jgi:hypothetical protein
MGIAILRLSGLCHVLTEGGLDMAPEFYDELEDFEYLENPIAVTTVVSRMVESLRSVKKSLMIYAGEAYWVVFDDPEYLAELNRLADLGVKTQIVVGPAISKGGGKRSPKIVELAEKNVVELYYRRTRGKEKHFRILDEEVIWVQPSHPPLQPLHLREEVKCLTRTSSAEEFERLVKLFKRCTTEENRVLKPREEYIFLRSSELRAVTELAEKEDGDYDDLDKEQISNLLNLVHNQKEIRQARIKAAQSHTWTWAAPSW